MIRNIIEENVVSQLKESARLKLMLADTISAQIVEAALAVTEAFKAGGKLFIMGNGGSAADAQHLATEFISRFKIERKALPAIALTTDSSILSAIGNDVGFETVFSRQLEALANHKSDMILAISTSGNSANVLAAVVYAKGKRLRTIGLTRDGGMLKDMVDIAIAVPSQDTQRIQEAHITIGHILCDVIEQELFI